MAHPLSDPTLARAFLDQDRVWAPGGYVPNGTHFVQIAGMEPGHALDAANWVFDNARRVWLAVYVEEMIQPQPDGTVLGRIVDDYEARIALLNTPLFKALMRRAAVKPESVLPWETAAASSAPTPAAAAGPVARRMRADEFSVYARTDDADDEGGW